MILAQKDSEQLREQLKKKSEAFDLLDLQHKQKVEGDLFLNQIPI